MTRYCCICCGHRTLEAAPTGTWQLCEVCCYEDVQPVTGQLRAAQEGFAAHGVCDLEVAELSRPPTGEEQQPSWFFPLSQAEEVLVAELIVAFGDQDLDGGVSLAEAELIDDYSLRARTMHDPPPPGFGRSGPWHVLSRADLELYSWTNFNFQDERGLRYHAPATMRLALMTPDTSVDTTALIWVLANGHLRDSLVDLLTPSQRRVTARYLAHLATDRAHFDASDAMAALQACWGVFLEADQRRNVLGEQ